MFWKEGHLEFKKRLQFHPLLTRTLTLVEKTREFKNPRTTIACEQKTKRRRKSRPRKFETYNSSRAREKQMRRRSDNSHLSRGWSHIHALNGKSFAMLPYFTREASRKKAFLRATTISNSC